MDATLRDRYAGAHARRTPLIGAHRGNSAELPENTLAAFRSALALGVDIVECDVHLSADDELIVIHDATLDRTTDGTGAVRGHTMAELRALDAGDGLPPPTLDELCEVVASHGAAGLCVEIKQPETPYPGIEERVVDALRAHGLTEVAVVISFHHPTVAEVKRLAPALLTGALLDQRPPDPGQVLRACRGELYAPHYLAMDPEITTAIHEAGGYVGCWTVDDADAAAWCRTCNPDSVFTNSPRTVTPLLR